MERQLHNPQWYDRKTLNSLNVSRYKFVDKILYTNL